MNIIKRAILFGYFYVRIIVDKSFNLKMVCLLEVAIISLVNLFKFRDCLF